LNFSIDVGGQIAADRQMIPLIHPIACQADEEGSHTWFHACKVEVRFQLNVLDFIGFH
jgi:hypothetical protein